jgi:hypothetical protein
LYSLQLNAAANTKTVVATGTSLSIDSSKRYACGFWLYVPTALTAGTLALKIGTWSSPTFTSSKTLTTVTLANVTPDSWNFISIAFDLDGQAAEDLRLAFYPASLDSPIYVTGLQFAEMQEYNHAHFALFAGALNPSLKDSFGDAATLGFAFTQSASSGILQRYLRDWFDTYLPSDAAPSIADPT